MDAAIDVRFCCKVHHSVRRFLAKALFDHRGIADITLYEPVFRMVCHQLQIFEISGVRQLIEYCDARRAPFGQRQAYKCGPDESRAASYKEFHLC